MRIKRDYYIFKRLLVLFPIIAVIILPHRNSLIPVIQMIRIIADHWNTFVMHDSISFLCTRLHRIIWHSWHLLSVRLINEVRIILNFLEGISWSYECINWNPLLILIWFSTDKVAKMGTKIRIFWDYWRSSVIVISNNINSWLFFVEDILWTHVIDWILSWFLFTCEWPSLIFLKLTLTCLMYIMRMHPLFFTNMRCGNYLFFLW